MVRFPSLPIGEVAYTAKCNEITVVKLPTANLFMSSFSDYVFFSVRGERLYLLEVKSPYVVNSIIKCRQLDQSIQRERARLCVFKPECRLHFFLLIFEAIYFENVAFKVSQQIKKAE